MTRSKNESFRQAAERELRSICARYSYKLVPGSILQQGYNLSALVEIQGSTVAARKSGLHGKWRMV